MKTLEDTPSADSFPELSSPDDSSSLLRRRHLLHTIQGILKEHVHLEIEHVDASDDHVLSYARDLLTLGLLYLEFSDAIREGDGERILRCWRFFLLVFKATGRTNYSKEAFVLLAQYHFIFSDRMRMQLLWSRTVNVHGCPGKNITCDLHMEHLNRECKSSISGLGANITDSTITRVGKALRSSTVVLEAFDQETSVKPQSGHHATRSSEKDMDRKSMMSTFSPVILAGVIGYFQIIIVMCCRE